MLVLTDLYYPGWEARVNGRTTAINATDIAFRGVAIDAGRSTVEFRYRPAGFRQGVIAAAIAVFTATAAILISSLRRRPPATGQGKGQTE
jgi:uncharacterized membrane protein YfhO